MKTARSLFYLGLASDGSGQRHMYAVSGWTSPGVVTKTCERYDPAADRWCPVASVPTGLHEHAGMYYILYTYVVIRVTYTYEYRACIWTSLGGPGYNSRSERCIYQSSRHSQGTVNGGAVSK